MGPSIYSSFLPLPAPLPSARVSPPHLDASRNTIGEGKFLPGEGGEQVPEGIDEIRLNVPKVFEPSGRFFIEWGGFF
jgi:hypothetical protein